MKEEGFSLRKWNSNCQSFRERIKQSEECSQSAIEALPKENDSAQILKQEDSSRTEDNESQTEQFVKILGIHWDVIRDA